MRGRTSAAAAALALAFAGVGLSVAPAAAACVPNGSAVPSGATVTCTGTDTTGVGNATQSNVTVNVLPGAAIVLGDNMNIISLLNFNSVNNNGALVAGNASATAGSVFGIIGGSSNTIVNNGSITPGNASAGFAGSVVGITATNS